MVHHTKQNKLILLCSIAGYWALWLVGELAQLTLVSEVILVARNEQEWQDNVLIKTLTANNISHSKCKYKLRHFPNISLHYQWEKLLTVSICCWVLYICHIELAIAGCWCFWCFWMQLLTEVGIPTPISNEVCDGIMRPGTQSARCNVHTSSAATI